MRLLSFQAQVAVGMGRRMGWQESMTIVFDLDWEIKTPRSAQLSRKVRLFWGYSQL